MLCIRADTFGKQVRLCLVAHSSQARPLAGTGVCWQELYLKPRFGRWAARLCQGFFILLLGRAPQTTLVYKHTACRDPGAGSHSGPERRRWPFLPRWKPRPGMLTSIKSHANICLEDSAYAKPNTACSQCCTSRKWCGFLMLLALSWILVDSCE